MNCEEFRQKALEDNKGGFRGAAQILGMARHLKKCRACQAWTQAEAKKPEYAKQRAKAQEVIDDAKHKN